LYEVKTNPVPGIIVPNLILPITVDAFLLCGFINIKEFAVTVVLLSVTAPLIRLYYFCLRENTILKLG